MADYTRPYPAGSRVGALLLAVSLLWPTSAFASEQAAAEPLVLPQITVHPDPTRDAADGKEATETPIQSESDPELRVSVVGRSNSLRATVEAVCDQTGVELRSYQAPDRKMRARYEAMTLSRLFERLLRRESFVLGFRGGPPGTKPRVAWLQVVGTKHIDDSIVSGIPAGRGSSAISFPVDALVSADPNVRRRVTMDLVAKLRSDTAYRERLLATPDADLVAALAGTPYGDQFLTRLRSMLREKQINTKLTRVQQQLRKR